MRKTLIRAALAATSLMAGPAMADQTNGYGVATSAVTGDYFTFSKTVSAYRSGQDSSGNYTGMRDVAPTQFVAGCEREIELGSRCSGAFGGTTDPGFNATASSNSASLVNGLRSDLPGLLASSAFARADLSKGELGVEAISDYRHSTQSVAQFTDTLNFTVAGAIAESLTNITVRFTLDGTLVGTQGESIRDYLGFGGAFADVTYNLGNGGDPSIFRQGGWISYNWDGATSGLTTFTGVYALSGASQTIGIFQSLLGGAQNGGQSLYGHTSAFSFLLPGNVTYTSASGVFLNGLNPTGGVPEPASWALMIAGFGLTGAAMRRRARVTVTCA